MLQEILAIALTAYLSTVENSPKQTVHYLLLFEYCFTKSYSTQLVLGHYLAYF